jgi:hypothetical protein
MDAKKDCWLFKIFVVNDEGSGKISAIPPWKWTCENSYATEVKCSNIPQKSKISYRKRREMNVKAAENQNFPATIPHFPAATTF